MTKIMSKPHLPTCHYACMSKPWRLFYYFIHEKSFVICHCTCMSKPWRLKAVASFIFCKYIGHENTFIIHVIVHACSSLEGCCFMSCLQKYILSYMLLHMHAQALKAVAAFHVCKMHCHEATSSMFYPEMSWYAFDVQVHEASSR